MHVDWQDIDKIGSIIKLNLKLDLSMLIANFANEADLAQEEL